MQCVIYVLVESVVMGWRLLVNSYHTAHARTLNTDTRTLTQAQRHTHTPLRHEPSHHPADGPCWSAEVGGYVYPTIEADVTAGGGVVVWRARAAPRLAEIDTCCSSTPLSLAPRGGAQGHYHYRLRHRHHTTTAVAAIVAA